MRLTYTKKKRFPHSYELLGNNNHILKNLKLNPEIIYTSNLSYNYKIKNRSFSFNLFYHNFIDPIQVTYLSTASDVRYENKDNYYSYGTDINLIQNFKKLGGKINFTYLKSKIYESNSIFLNKTPAFIHPFQTNLYFWIQIIPSLHLSTQANYKSAYFQGDLNHSDQKTPSFWLWNSTIKYQISVLSLEFKVHNIINTIYQDFRYHPNAGRSYHFNFQIHI